MRVRKVHSTAAIIGLALMVVSAWTPDASAAPQQLDCVLTDTGAQPGSENQSIVVIFDDAAKTLKAQEGSQSYSFSTVSISNVSISGEEDSVSLGIDRSSLGIVWQRYGADKVVTEFGQCRRNDRPTAADTH